MNIIRERQQKPHYIGGSDLYVDDRVASMQQATCAACGNDRWPLAMLREKDGRWYCPNDFDSMNNREAVERIAEDMAEGADRPVRWLTIQPAMNMLDETPTGAVTSLYDSTARSVSQQQPLSLARGGAAKTLYLGGVAFTSSDTISYTTGITDSVAPVITSTLITLTLVASIGATPSDFYSLTFNGTTFRNIFSVR